MSNIRNWISHLLWLLGTIYIDIFILDFRSALEGINLAYLHVFYKGTMIERSTALSFSRRTKTFLEQCVGILVTTIILFGLFKLI